MGLISLSTMVLLEQMIRKLFRIQLQSRWEDVYITKPVLEGVHIVLILQSRAAATLTIVIILFLEILVLELLNLPLHDRNCAKVRYITLCGSSFLF